MNNGNLTDLSMAKLLSTANTYKVFLSLMPVLGLLQQLLSLLQFSIYQLLLQVLVLEHFIDVLQKKRAGGVNEMQQVKPVMSEPIYRIYCQSRAIMLLTKCAESEYQARYQ